MLKCDLVQLNSASSLKDIFEQADLDHNQVLDRNEFKALLIEADRHLIELPVPFIPSHQCAKLSAFYTPSPCPE